VNLENDDSIKEIYCGMNHTVVESKKGSLYSFGMGTMGQLGHGDFENKFEPTKVKDLRGKIITMACGGHHTLCAIGNK
jgi:alpha-tubulin suppressor-like RCC1 family protein